MKGLRIVVKQLSSSISRPRTETVQVLVFQDVTDAQGVVNTLRRKPAVSAISRALVNGGRVEIESLQ